MSISAINCSPIKPQVSFGNMENVRNVSEGYNNRMETLDKYVKTDDIKSPLEVGISIASCIAGVYLSGQLLGAVISKCIPSIPVIMENTLKQGSKLAQQGAQALKNDAPGKLNTAKNIAGKAIGSMEQTARGVYQKIAYKGIAPDVINPEKAAKAFQNVAGAVAVASAVPQVLCNDSDGDGVKDILQKSQNAYTGSKSGVGDMMNNLNALGEIAAVLS